MQSENGMERTVILSGIDSVGGVIAYILYKQFIEQGIIGKPLFFRKRKKSYVLCSVRSYQLTSAVRKSSAPAQEHLYFASENERTFKEPDPAIELWKPDNIPAEIWEKALEQFTYTTDLQTNIERHLVPLMGDIRSLMPYDQLRDDIVRAFLETDILMTPIRITRKAVCYFDENSVYRKDGKDRRDMESLHRSSLWYCRLVNMRIWIKASKQFQEGDSLTECVDLFLQTDLCEIPKKESTLDYLVTRIESASYEREPENKNKRTFDRIHVFVNLSHTFYKSWDELRIGIIDYQKEISKMVIDKIKKDTRFQKYGVSISYLRLANIILRRSFCLEYIFELKDISADKSSS